MASSYTPKEVTKMIDIYTDNPCLEVVNRLSVLLNRPKRSIISKLVKEGVYVRKGYTTKTGTRPITKLEIVHIIEAALGIKLPGLDKSPKSSLVILKDNVIDNCSSLEDALRELSRAIEVVKVRAGVRGSRGQSDGL